MEALVRTRGTAKGKLTIFKNYIVSTVEAQAEHGRPLDEVTALEIRERISRIRETYNKFEQIQAEIEAICGEEKAQEAGEYREQFETEYYQTIARAEFLLIRQALDANTRVASGSQAQEQLLQGAQVLPNAARQPNQHIILKTAGIRLPTIELPKFSGNFSDWLSFRDTFESLIHRNETIDPIQKFHYLKASLEGSAAQIIKSLEISAVNYAVAWSAICDRYNNKRLLAHNHVKAIFSISQMKQESASQIRETIDTLNKHLRALTALEQSTEQWDTLLIYIISTKLDGVTAREWEKERAGNDIPTLEEFKTFLISRADLLDSIEINEKDVSKSKQADRPKVKSFLVQKQRCSLCKEAHHLANCEQFLKLTPQRRAEQLKGSKLCLNCMKPGHFIKDCRASLCKKCSGKHNTLLHFEKQSSENATPVVESGSSSVLCSHSQQASGVLLATALVLVTDRRGKQRSVRALLDPGSQSSLITRKLCQELSLDTNRINTSIEAINGMALQIEHSCEVKIAAHYNNYEFRVKCLVTPEITSQLPSRRINFQSLQIPSNIKLADPSFYTPGGIDILIGGDWFWNLLCIGQFKIEQLTMQKTRLGWIAAGPLEPTSVNPIKCNFAKEVDIDRQLTKFWNIEEIQDQRIFTSEEREAEAHFVRTTRRNEDGRFIVSMPFKKGPDELGESRAIARRRLINLEKKLHRTEALEQQYSAFLEEYERLGHMRKISNEATQGPMQAGRNLGLTESRPVDTYLNIMEAQSAGLAESNHAWHYHLQRRNISLSDGCQEMLWLTKLLKDFQENVKLPVKMYEDNQSCIKLTDNQKFSKRTKHIDTKYHFIRDLSKSNKILLEYCKSEDMIADMLTKALHNIRLRRLSEASGLELFSNK
ncbi:PREDICTED: uncharacterized protein LOC105449455 [Wasmannia auropunctata]|uniref:uncharacterized protein LOC105449455 n=1 Tax=Wasmannia auropunctata TaxID=64793 RepID=UPI0005EECD2C|nr:PREDICTED: uncharacterized protein LOC105449455 [Wasmannia auropunctata]